MITLLYPLVDNISRRVLLVMAGGEGHPGTRVQRANLPHRVVQEIKCPMQALEVRSCMCLCGIEREKAPVLGPL